MNIKQSVKVKNLDERRNNAAVRDRFSAIDYEIRRKRIRFTRDDAVKDNLYLSFDRDKTLEREEL